MRLTRCNYRWFINDYITICLVCTGRPSHTACVVRQRLQSVSTPRLHSTNTSPPIAKPTAFVEWVRHTLANRTSCLIPIRCYLIAIRILAICSIWNLGSLPTEFRVFDQKRKQLTRFEFKMLVTPNLHDSISIISSKRWRFSYSYRVCVCVPVGTLHVCPPEVIYVIFFLYFADFSMSCSVITH